MNVLVTSISKKVPLIKEVRKALDQISKSGKVIGADADPHCIGKFFVDEFWEMPRLSELEIQTFIEDCLQRQIKAIIPTRDGELLFFAENRRRFEESGILPMVSNYSGVKLCLDKLKFYHTGHELDYPVIQTSMDIDDILHASLYVVKERFGSGSRGVGLHLTREEAIRHARTLSQPVFQPHIFGDEYSVDLYLMTGSKVKGAIVRKRELVVDGESHITSSVEHPEIELLASNFVQELGLYGHINLQVMEDSLGSLHIIECNCRFGGASRLSISAGLDTFLWFLRETRGEDITHLPFHRSQKNKRLIRYHEDLIIDVE